ncbi:patatin-like phospholipase family protein [Stenotrophobium rhamnosiphilum]|uniref:Cyclic nucleotide-binding protein n=1 Tax=Stenotrophobium rhamnosiphilum TaxID=2029166 RepID=A0A2T5MBF8_9GAMM|nr:patatin-like phospholipase family protein [Stenotrophobium rhamnosiphilum]PTU29085.1 cyclic nucleotide-binding protein [Stenotrophobium rhamnosiphilum]
MDLQPILYQCSLFSRLTPTAMDALIKHITVREIKSGGVLFNEGDISDCMYIVATGRLRAVLDSGEVIGDIGRYEPVGEIGIIADESRSATVHAVRDSILLKLVRADLIRFISTHPKALIEMSRVMIARMRQASRDKALESARSVHTFAVIPASGDVDAHDFAERFSQALAQHDTVKLIDDVLIDAELGYGSSRKPFQEDEANARMMTMLGDIESKHRYLVYAAGGETDSWARRCMRQADRIIVVVDASKEPQMTPMLERLRSGGSARVPVDLVLLRPEGADAGNVLTWRECTHASAHYFLRPGNADDLEKMVRQLTGRGIGLVLGGGGARGFAHIGLLRALHELKIPVDLTGGSSMGGFFAALVACGYDYNEIAEIARETFVSHNYLNDYMLPMVALIRGRKFVNRLHDVFGERQIEHLRMPFFCVSTNLTRGTPMVHDRGPLYMWLACSMCVPGVAPPIAYRNELFVDGAVINSLPTDVMQAMRRGPIVASDVSTAGGDLSAPGIEGPDPEGLLRWNAPAKRPGLFSIIFRTATLTSESGTAARAARADAYVRMPVTGIALFDWKKMDEVVERGYRHAMEQLTPLRDSLLK